MGYLIINKEGLVTDINQTGADILGLQKKALTQRCFSRYIANNDQALFSQLRQHVFNNEIMKKCELKLIHSSKSLINVQVAIKTMINNNSNEKELLLTLSEISTENRIPCPSGKTV
jgi:nitrogen-specific signal transduction histidine kinase